MTKNVASAMPPCDICGGRPNQGLGYNRRALYVCDDHYRKFRRAQNRLEERELKIHPRRMDRGDSERVVARRIMVALGIWTKYFVDRC